MKTIIIIIIIISTWAQYQVKMRESTRIIMHDWMKYLNFT